MINLIEDKEKERIFQFIKENPSNPLALEIMLYKVYKRESINLYDTFSFLYNKLAPELKASNKGKNLNQILMQINQSKVGSIAPNFTLIDIDGHSLSLNSFRNKSIILLDFWASWCTPCRSEFPFLKDLYKKYHSKGFEIIGISRDEEIKLWKKAIKNDDIRMWRQISTKKNDNKILSDYFVSAVPLKILIDKDGRIIGRWRGGGELNQIELLTQISKYLDFY